MERTIYVDIDMRDVREAAERYKKYAENYKEMCDKVYDARYEDLTAGNLEDKEGAVHA